LVHLPSKSNKLFPQTGGNNKNPRYNSEKHVQLILCRNRG